MEFSHTFGNTENFLEHWANFLFAIDSKTLETDAAVCIIHLKKFKMPIFFIKSLFKIFLFLIYNCFFIHFCTNFVTFV